MVIAPEWKSLKPGDCIDVVMRAVALATEDGQQGDHIMHSLDKTQRWIVVSGCLPQVADHYVAFGLVVTGVGSRLQVKVDGETVIHALSPPWAGSFGKVIELCSGMGAWSTAALELGLDVLAGVDSNGNWETIFRALHPHSEFLKGDIGANDVLCRLHELNGARAILLAGVSCQPYSKAGDRRGMADDRALSLPKALKAAWMMQAPVLVLECVPDVLQDSAFQALLKEACVEGGFHLSQHIMKLQDAWCTRRERWFGVLTAIPMGPCRLVDMPSSSMHRCVRDVMPFIKQWPAEDLQQLMLNLYELSKFYDFACGGIEALYLRMDAQLPTTLHSIGNQLYACACGCRPALSYQRLAARGLFGVLIPLERVHENMMRRDCRYPHPKELMLLNGGLPGSDLGPNHRLAMAGIGQCVSPLQGIWVLSLVVKHCENFLALAGIDPVEQFEKFLAKIIQQRDELWPVEVPLAQDEANGPIRVKIHWTVDATMHEIEVSPLATIQQLIDAERVLSGVQDAHVICSLEGRVLDGQSLVAFHRELVIRPSVHVAPQLQLADVIACPCADWDDNRNGSVTPTVPFEVDESDIPGPVMPFDVHAHARMLASSDTNYLFRLQCPLLANQQQLLDLVSLRITQDERLAILQVQGQLWSDDEMRRSLTLVAETAPKEQHVVMWDPLALTWLVSQNKMPFLAEFVARVATDATIVSAVVLDRHWYPLIWRCESGQAFLFSCGADFNTHPVLDALHQTFCEAWTCASSPVTVAKVFSQLEGLCGAIALAYVEHLVFGREMLSSIDQARQYHMLKRSQFQESLLDGCPCPWIWGRGDSSWKARLEALLQEHGVAHEQTGPRAKLVLDRLGEEGVIKALSGQNAWRSLKWLANSLTPPFQLIQPHELSSAVEKRVAEGGQIGRKNQKQSAPKGKGKGKKGSGGLKIVDPHGLRVEPGLFHCGDSQPLSQIDVASIGPASSGVFLLVLSDAAPYLRAGKVISAGGLGLLLVDCVVGQVQTDLEIAPVKFPAICVANAEPLLLEGVLCQLGKLKVMRTTPSPQCSLISMSTCVARILVFRDLLDVSWDSFREHPMKHLFAKLPILRPCGDEQCEGNCEAWHPAQSCVIEDPLMEVWNKHWMSLAFNSVGSSEAECFSVHVRLPSCLQLQLQHYSGVAGVFVEPRQVDGKTPSDSYHVIWLPKTTYQDLLHLKQSTPGIVGLARLGHKFGVRCLSADAQNLHALVRPGGSFLPAGKKLHFSIGPVPYGTLKSSIVAVLASIPWVARPLQPIATPKSIEGVLWKVQAVASPVVTVVNTDCGELVISKLDDPVPEVQPRPAVVASAHTLQLCTNPSAKGAVDMLQVHDPWASAVSRKPVQSGVAPNLDPVAALEKKVVEAVLAKIPQNQMEVDSSANEEALVARVDLLERKVHELHDGQCRIQSVVTEQGKQHGQQLQRLESAVTDNVAKLGSFQMQFQRQLEQQQTQLDGLFKQQLEKMEDLLAKKARKE